MRAWSAQHIAVCAGATLVAAPDAEAGPERAVIDSRETGPGDLFVGLPGATEDGGRFAAQAIASGAWGVLTTPTHAVATLGQRGVVLAAEDPLRALQRLARAWRRELGAGVIGVTGSTGKTSTKDLLHAVLAPHRRTIASRGNFNTEIGLPLEILGAPAGTEVLVLEMAMRGAGQIAELVWVAEPDVGVIVSIGPVHLELLGTIEAIAAAKAELIAGLAPGATAVIPAGEGLLEPHLRDDLEIVTFGEDGDVRLLAADGEHVEIELGDDRLELEVPFTQAHLRRNLLAAVAAARALGVVASGRIELELSPGRGQRAQLPDGVLLIDDCYNANPMSMRAALEDLAVSAPRDTHPRRVAVLGDMLELGPDERRFHEEIGAAAEAAEVDVLITVGRLAAAMTDRFDGEAYPVADAEEAASLLPELLAPGDAVLVKASRGVGLEVVCRALEAGVA
ncbi:MAG TPA: UDP-N-acetylmuramoyl-tripeptide--D-alanyl-D-alanine ligase [Solirubrobacteraceae bacterium]|nr:UDP-N-acetylmuramoyl-tripeptide--D-alanyl-D-alanine ligase [Solirubrobacteraceae bacterium]